MPCLNLLYIRISQGRISLFILSFSNNIKEMPVPMFVLIKQKTGISPTPTYYFPENTDLLKIAKSLNLLRSHVQSDEN